MACYDVVRVDVKDEGENAARARRPQTARTQEWKKVADAGPLPNVDAARAADALAFHDEIAAAVAKNRNDADYRANGYKIVPMVGVRQATLQSIVMESGRLVGRQLRPPSVDVTLEGGDGRVPRVSAAPIEIFGEYRELFFVEQHGSLQNNPQLLDDLVERLTQMQANKPVRGTFEMRSMLKPAAIALRVEDLYLYDEPIRIEAALRDRDGNNGDLLATVEGVDHPSHKANLRNERERRRLDFGVGQARARSVPRYCAGNSGRARHSLAADRSVWSVNGQHHGERRKSIHDFPGGPRIGNHGRNAERAACLARCRPGRDRKAHPEHFRTRFDAGHEDERGRAAVIGNATLAVLPIPDSDKSR